LKQGGVNLKKIMIVLLVLGFILVSSVSAAPGNGKGVGVGNGLDDDFVPPGQGGTAPGQDGSTPGQDGSAPGQGGIDWIPEV
jgi:hypothetical protein